MIRSSSLVVAWGRCGTAESVGVHGGTDSNAMAELEGQRFNGNGRNFLTCSPDLLMQTAGLPPIPEGSQNLAPGRFRPTRGTATKSQRTP